jgi:hypothetical protein
VRSAMRSEQAGNENERSATWSALAVVGSEHSFGINGA